MIFFNLREKILTSPAKRDKFIVINFFVGLLLNLALWLALAVNFSGSLEYVVLRYNIYFGVSWFGSWLNILIIPGIGLVVLLVNYIIAALLYLNYIIISYFLAYAASLVNLLALVAGLLLIYSNF